MCNTEGTSAHRSEFGHADWNTGTPVFDLDRSLWRSSADRIDRRHCLRSISGGVPGARVQIVNGSTGLNRQATTSGQGGYAFAGLPPGEYEVSVQTNGIERMSRSAIVEAGTTTTTDFKLTIGEVKQSVNVDAA